MARAILTDGSASLNQHPDCLEIQCQFIRMTGKFDFSLDRNDLLRALEDMGIAVPPSTKLADDALKKRLRQGLSASQTVAVDVRDSDKHTIDIAHLPTWPSNRAVAEKAKIQNFDDFVTEDTPSVRKNSFLFPRAFVYNAAVVFDAGGRTLSAVCKIDNMDCGIFMRVRTPLPRVHGQY